MNKRGLQISFGIIFSIIIIIAIIGVAFYAISYFVDLGRCTDISLFHNDFQEEVNEIWNSEIARESFVGTLPGGIEAVCFKNPESQVNLRGGEYEELQDYFVTRGNTFLYPVESACGQESRIIDHLDLSELEWHCFGVREKQVRIPLEKGSFDSLVRVLES